MKDNKMSYFETKRRMVELVYILRCDPKNQSARSELSDLKKKDKLAWLEVQ